MEEDQIPEPVPLEPQERNSKSVADQNHKPVPVTLITGFLGSGKTTLVRHILTAPHGMRVAVILNEFGEGVEDAYFQEDMGLRDTHGEWVQLDNGCMCCSVKSEFVQALEALLQKEQRPEYILIETTGMANPGPVAQALWTDEEVEAGVQLDSIITVVDALNIDRQLHAVRSEAAVNEAQVQVAYADLILLNKMDLCGEEAIDRAEADIRAINSSVTILRTSHCAVDLHTLLNRSGYKRGAEVSLAPIAEDDAPEDDGVPDACSEGAEAIGELASKLTAANLASAGLATTSGADSERPSCSACAAGGTGGGGGPGSVVSESLGGGPPVGKGGGGLARSSVGGNPGSFHSRAVSLSLDPLGTGEEVSSPGPLAHDPRISTLTLSTDQPLDLDRIKSFLDDLLWDRETHPEDIYRVKGVLHVAGSERKHMLQAVYEMYNISPSVPWQAGEPRVSRVVVIGRALNKPALEQSFQQLCTAPAS